MLSPSRAQTESNGGDMHMSVTVPKNFHGPDEVAEAQQARLTARTSQDNRREPLPVASFQLCRDVGQPRANRIQIPASDFKYQSTF